MSWTIGNATIQMKAIKSAFLSKLLFIFQYLLWKLGLFFNLRFGRVCQKRIFTVSTLCTNVAFISKYCNLLHGTNQWMTQTTLAACEIILPVYANNGFMTRLNEGNGLVYTVKAGEIIGRKKFKLALRSPRRKLPQLSWWWIITEIFCRYWWRKSGFWNLHSFSPNHFIQLKGNISLRQTKV